MKYYHQYVTGNNQCYAVYGSYFGINSYHKHWQDQLASPSMGNCCHAYVTETPAGDAWTISIIQYVLLFEPILPGCNVYLDKRTNVLGPKTD